MNNSHMASEKLLQAIRFVNEAKRAYEEGDNFGVVIRAYQAVQRLSQFLLNLYGFYVTDNPSLRLFLVPDTSEAVKAFKAKLVDLERRLHFSYMVEESSLINSVNIRGSEVKSLVDLLGGLVDEAYKIYDEFHN